MKVLAQDDPRGRMPVPPERRYAVCLALLALCGVGAASAGRAADISGDSENPNEKFGRDVSYRLEGDAQFGWRTGAITGDIDLNGHAFVMNTGGGNHTVFSGAITGRGAFEWRGGGVPQVGPSVLTGTRANTFAGAFTLTRGILDLDKPAGVDAIPGDLVVGVKGPAIVRLAKPNQVNDAANVTLGGPDISGLELRGHDEAFATLTVKTHAVIDMGETPAALLVGDSSACLWDLTKTVTIRGHKPGRDKLVFGRDGKGLSAAQLARIGFADPAGLPAGLYKAKMGTDGQVTPETRVEAVNPPFAVSPAARAARARLYETNGLATLTAAGGLLADGLTIAFFGDSITWQNGYIAAIDKALKAGEGTKGKSIRLINRGINGGGVLQVRDGAEKGAFPGDSAQKPFAEMIAADKAGLAVVFIGVNDVWWRNTAPDVFAQALRDLVAAAAASGTRMVLATLTVHGELPDGRNGDDPKLDQYAEITRKVAAETRTTLVDLRRAYLAYLQNHNAQLRVDGTLYFKPAGVLTYDGVHPNAEGVALLANLIGDGVRRALVGGAAVVPPAAGRTDAPAPAAAADDRSSPAFVPWPKKVELRGAPLRLAQARIVATDPALLPLARVLSEELAATTGLKLPAVGGAARAGDIALTLDAALAGEAYRLDVGSQAVVAGGNYGAVAMGTVTLLQAVDGQGGSAGLPRMRVDDQPDKAYRGLLIDVARQYHALDGLKQIVELCRLYKVRYLQLHLTDDQGFMFPSKAFPKALAQSQNGGASYTLEALADLVAYADARAVTLVPEFDIPGHSAALNRSDPDFWMIRGTKPYEHHASINFARPEVIQACETIIGEMCQVFKSSPYFHIGGDEADYVFADQNAHFQAAFKELGLGPKGQHELYRRFLVLMDAAVKKNGKRTIVWEGFGREPESKFPIPKDVIVMVYENRFYQPNLLVEDGYTVINASWTPLYVMRVLTEYTRKIYDWNICRFGAYTKDFAKTTWRQLAPADTLIGSQICSWEQREAVELANLRWPLAALSERNWSVDGGRSWPNFQQRLATTDALLEQIVHVVHWTCDGLSNVEERMFERSFALTMRADEPGTIRYTLDGKIPTVESPAYTGPVTVDKPTFVRATLFDAAGGRMGALTEDHFRQSGK